MAEKQYGTVWVLYTLEPCIEPEMMKAVRTHCVGVKIFQGTLAGGNIVLANAATRHSSRHRARSRRQPRMGSNRLMRNTALGLLAHRGGPLFVAHGTLFHGWPVPPQSTRASVSASREPVAVSRNRLQPSWNTRPILARLTYSQTTSPSSVSRISRPWGCSSTNSSSFGSTSAKLCSAPTHRAARGPHARAR